MSDAHLTPGELFRLLSALCEDTLSAADAQRLESALAADAGVRRAYIEYLDMHAELRWDHGAAASACREAADAISADDQAAALVLGDMLAGGDLLGGEVRPRSSNWPVLGWTAAGLLLVVAVTAVLRLGGIPTTRPESGDSSTVVGQLIHVHQVDWDGAAPREVGAALEAGDELSLASGMVELEFHNGAHLALQGPARLKIESAERVFLLRGALSATIPPTAIGFTALTSAVEVIDLGTRFGLLVDERGSAEVQVFQGQVDARLPGGKDRPARQLRLVDDQAVQVDSQEGLLAIGPIGAIGTRDLRTDALRGGGEVLARYDFHQGSLKATDVRRGAKAGKLQSGPGTRLQWKDQVGSHETVLLMHDLEGRDASEAVDRQDYVEVSLAATRGNVLDVTGFSYDHRTNGNDPRWTVVRWSVDGFASNLNDPVLAFDPRRQGLAQSDGSVVFVDRALPLDKRVFGQESIPLDARGLRSVRFRIYGILGRPQRPISLDDLTIRGQVRQADAAADEPSPIRSTSGRLRALPAAPRSVAREDLQDNRHIFAFRERAGYALPSEVEVNLSEPGKYEGYSAARNVIPAGTKVDCYLLHFCSVSQVVRSGGTIEFDRPVLGLFGDKRLLQATDETLGSPGTKYLPAGSNRHIEKGDVVKLSGDRRKLTIDWQVMDGVDQVRVLVEAR